MKRRLSSDHCFPRSRKGAPVLSGYIPSNRLARIPTVLGIDGETSDFFILAGSSHASVRAIRFPFSCVASLSMLRGVPEHASFPVLYLFTEQNIQDAARSVYAERP